MLNSHKIASAQSEAPAGWEKGMRRGMLLKKTSTASTSHMTLAKFLFVCSSRGWGRGSDSGEAHRIVLRLLVLFAARGNHNVCIIYLRFAFKGFKLLFNLVFPSWVTPCDDNDNNNDDDENKNNSNKYANFCAFYWKYSAERKWQVGRGEGGRDAGEAWHMLQEPLLSVWTIFITRGRCWQSISRGIRQGNQYGNAIEFKTEVNFA